MAQEDNQLTFRENSQLTIDIKSGARLGTRGSWPVSGKKDIFYNRRRVCFLPRIPKW